MKLSQLSRMISDLKKDRGDVTISRFVWDADTLDGSTLRWTEVEPSDEGTRYTVEHGRRVRRG